MLTLCPHCNQPDTATALGVCRACSQPVPTELALPAVSDTFRRIIHMAASGAVIVGVTLMFFAWLGGS